MATIKWKNKRGDGGLDKASFSRRYTTAITTRKLTCNAWGGPLMLLKCFNAYLCANCHSITPCPPGPCILADCHDSMTKASARSRGSSTWTANSTPRGMNHDTRAYASHTNEQQSSPQTPPVPWISEGKISKLHLTPTNTKLTAAEWRPGLN